MNLRDRFGWFESRNPSAWRRHRNLSLLFQEIRQVASASCAGLTQSDTFTQYIRFLNTGILSVLSNSREFDIMAMTLCHSLAGHPVASFIGRFVGVLTQRFQV